MASMDFDDEYVTNALKSDAEKATNKYSSIGLSAYLPRSKTSSSAPKANTRFLRNLIRETDTHNTALLAKEKREARERERERERQARKRDRTRLSPPESEDEYRKRRRRHDEEGKSHRRRDEARVDAKVEHQTRRHHRERLRSQSPDRSRKRRDHGGDRKRYSRPGYGHESASNSDDGMTGSHRRNAFEASKRSAGSDTRREKRSQAKVRRRYSSDTGKSQSPSPSRSGTTHRRRSLAPHRSEPSRKVNETTRNRSPNSRASSSDPLEAIVGPAPEPQEPAVRVRGRGTFSSSAAMDNRFSSSYDPKVDVQPDPETEDDWDQALEALRDRQKWQQQGAERLKAAGFSELEIKKWEKGDAKDESDVRWAKLGEGREWDRGKVVGDDGIQLKAEWGRLKDT